MLFNRKKLVMLQNMLPIYGDLAVGSAIKEYIQKLTPYLRQTDVVSYFESFWKFELSN